MSHTVYYWRGSAEVRQDIIVGLQAANFQVIQFRLFEDLLDSIDRRTPVLVIVDASSGQHEASRMIVELSGTAKLYSIALMFVCQQATKRVEGMRISFPRIIPVDTPYRVQSVIQGAVMIERSPDSAREVSDLIAMGAELLVNEVSNTTEKKDKEKGAGSSALVADDGSKQPSESSDKLNSAIDGTIQKESAQLSEKVEQGKELDGKGFVDDATKSGKVSRKTIEDSSEIIRLRMSKHSDPSRLDKSIGGETFSLASDASYFDSKMLFDGISLGVDLNVMLDDVYAQSKWLSAHSMRSVFVSSALANFLGFGAKRDSDLRLAGFFLNYPLKDLSSELIFCDIISNIGNESIKGLAEGFRQGADIVEEVVGNFRVAQTIRAVSNIIVGQPINLEKELREDAETLLGVEISSRRCWCNGTWNPSGAYQTIRYFRGRTTVISLSNIRKALVRMLAESVTVHVTVGNIFSAIEDVEELNHTVEKLRRDASLAACQAAALRAKRPRMKTCSVRIMDLSPGMILLNPLKAVDGRLVLDANVLLNEEIVFDLWQLAAVRALCPSVEVAVSY